mgnify:CR=1 FL=1
MDIEPLSSVAYLYIVIYHHALKELDEGSPDTPTSDPPTLTVSGGPDSIITETDP